MSANRRDRGSRRPSGRRLGAADRGSITAEFVAVIPAVVLMLIACIMGLQLAGLQLRLQDATADAARSMGRGDGIGVAHARLRSVVSGARLDFTHPDDLVCVIASAPAPSGVGALLSLTLTASSCALDGGR